MRACLQQHADVSTSSSLLSDLKNPPALRRMTSPRGLLAVSQAHFQSAVSSWALQPAVQERDSAKSTEDKRIHSTHSSGTSSFAHRKYQPARFV